MIQQHWTKIDLLGIAKEGSKQHNMTLQKPILVLNGHTSKVEQEWYPHEGEVTHAWYILYISLQLNWKAISHT